MSFFVKNKVNTSTTLFSKKVGTFKIIYFEKENENSLKPIVHIPPFPNFVK